MMDKGSMYKSILVIDDHKMVVNGIKLIVGPLFEHFYMAHDGASGISMVFQHFPQLIVVDHFLPDTSGDLLVRELKYKLPTAKVLAFSFSYSPEVIIKMLQAGVNGYVIKRETDIEFTQAVHKLMDGGGYFCKEARAHIIKRFSGSGTEDLEAKHLIANTKFSGKELALIKLLCKQMTSKEIGRSLNLSDRTVEQYRSAITRRIAAKNLAGVIKFALRNGIISIEEL